VVIVDTLLYIGLPNIMETSMSRRRVAVLLRISAHKLTRQATSKMEEREFLLAFRTSTPSPPPHLLSPHEMYHIGKSYPTINQKQCKIHVAAAALQGSSNTSGTKGNSL
jgi:hypothetical protein